MSHSVTLQMSGTIKILQYETHENLNYKKNYENIHKKACNYLKSSNKWQSLILFLLDKSRTKYIPFVLAH